MSQQIKKKFLSPEVIEYFDNQIDEVEQSVVALDESKADKSQVDAKDLELSEGLSTEEAARIAGDVQSLSDAKDYTDDQIAAIPEVKEVIESESSSAFPEAGEIGKIYVSKVDNKIYRYEESQGGSVELPEMPAAPSLSPTISITSADDLQATINAASDGDVIYLANGTYSLSSNLSISKKIALVGESQEGVLVEDTRGNAQSFVSVSSDDVTLKDLTIRHATTDSNIGHAIVVTGTGWPQSRLNNFRMYNVKSQYSKGGLSIRSNNFVVEGCTFEIVAGSSTRRGILHYGNGGDSFIKDCIFINNQGATLRAICPTSTSGSNPSDNQSGSLTIDGSTFVGSLSQFVNMDNHQGDAGDFELIVINNTTPESNAFVVSFGATANFGDLFSRIVLMNNNLTNSHSSGLGKGVLALDAYGGLFDYRSSELPVIAVGNVLGQLDFRSGYAEAAGSTGSIVGYKASQINEPTVEMSEGASGGSSSYVELSPNIDQDLSGIEESLVTLDEKIDTEKARIDADILVEKQRAEGQEAAIRSEFAAADADIQSQITALQGAEDVLFEDDASVYADGTAPIEDPTGRDGWYYKSAGSPEKINWYFFNGSETQVTVGQLDSLYAVATVDSSNTDTFHLVYYTKPEGDGNDAGSWYRSRQVYIPVEPFQRGEKALFYMGQEPDASLYPNLPRVQMQLEGIGGISVGLNDNSEELLATAFSTNSAAEANTVELVANKLGFNSSVYNKEYSLEIRGEFTLAGIKQSLLEEAIARQNAIDTEKARIDAILDASDADKDSFKEIVDLINSVDTENDEAFAGYVASNDAAMELKASIEYVDDAIAEIPSVDLSPIESRLDVLEAKGFSKGSLVVGEELSFIDLDKAYSVILSMSVGRLAVHEGEDYTTSLVDGVTRITWIGSLLSPDGAEAIETGDKVFWSGSY